MELRSGATPSGCILQTPCAVWVAIPCGIVRSFQRSLAVVHDWHRSVRSCVRAFVRSFVSCDSPDLQRRLCETMSALLLAQYTVNLRTGTMASRVSSKLSRRLGTSATRKRDPKRKAGKTSHARTFTLDATSTRGGVARRVVRPRRTPRPASFLPPFVRGTLVTSKTRVIAGA